MDMQPACGYVVRFASDVTESDDFLRAVDEPEYFVRSSYSSVISPAG